MLTVAWNPSQPATAVHSACTEFFLNSSRGVLGGGVGTAQSSSGKDENLGEGVGVSGQLVEEESLLFTDFLSP